MTNRKCTICRSIPGTKTRTAECSFNNGTCTHKSTKSTIFHQFLINWHRSWINIQKEFAISSILSFKNISSGTNVFKSTTSTTSNNPLVNIKLTINHFVFECKLNLITKRNLCTLFSFIQNIH